MSLTPQSSPPDQAPAPRLSLEIHPDAPERLGHVAATVLEIRLAMANIGASSAAHLYRGWRSRPAGVAALTFLLAARRVLKERQAGCGVMWRAIIHHLGDPCRLRRPSLDRHDRANSGSAKPLVRAAPGVTLALAAAMFVAAGMTAANAADQGFAKFVESVWPDAQKAGVSRETFELQTRGLEPDYKLPDLALPGRPATGAPAQAEFVQTPADYLKEATIARLASEGQKLMRQHRATLAAIEKRFGVPGPVILAIWGRETDYGRSLLPYDALRVVATQAYVGRRKEQYRQEFVLALKILDEGDVARKNFRSSWAGATGLTQFLPSEFYKHGVDFDGDGRVNIWTSAPDALASAAQQLVNKGWQPGLRWAYEVRTPQNFDCTQAVPEITRPIGMWLREGFAPVRGERLSADERAQSASLLQPEGVYGPSFLTTKNYFVIKEYNFSDLYVLFVGHLGDRMTNPSPFAVKWSASTQLRSRDVEAMQRYLTQAGFYRDKIDGKAGMQTRAAVGGFQKSAGLKVDCWPSEAVLRAMNGAAQPRH